eukprot:4348468-Lingulodinium_polyedra.AAC.1
MYKPIKYRSTVYHSTTCHTATSEFNPLPTVLLMPRPFALCGAPQGIRNMQSQNGSGTLDHLRMLA